jgi:hypothetical protein
MTFLSGNAVYSKAGDPPSDFALAAPRPKGLTEDSAPALQPIQLLRSFPQTRKEAGNAAVGQPCIVLHGVCAADGQPELSGLLGSPGDRGQQQRPAGDGLAMMLWVGQSDEQAPPIDRSGPPSRRTAVGGGQNPRKSGAGQKVGTEFAVGAATPCCQGDQWPKAGWQPAVKAASRRRRGPKARLYSGLPPSHARPPRLAAAC